MDEEVSIVDRITRGIKCSMYRIIRNGPLREKIQHTATQVSQIMILAALYALFRLTEITLSNNPVDLQN